MDLNFLRLNSVNKLNSVMNVDNNKDSSFSCNKSGSWLGIGTAIGVVVFATTNEPVWIAVGVAIGAALGLTQPKTKN